MLEKLVVAVNEANRANALNYTGLMYALLVKGVISPAELDEGRRQAKGVVDEVFGPEPEKRS